MPYFIELDPRRFSKLSFLADNIGLSIEDIVFTEIDHLLNEVLREQPESFLEEHDIPVSDELVKTITNA